ncbi:MAG: glutaminyl-peptide cyclotransferase [Thermoleophilales bacterium]|nr:glutaminyl-peptide cyclotransferase [Thermoleophilales bacterium]
MRPLVAVLLAQLVLAGILLILVATGTLNFLGDAAGTRGAKPAAAVQRADRFDENRAWAWLVKQVEIGPRPAGSPESRKLAAQIKKALPHGSYQAVPKGLRNVVGMTPGKDPKRRVVVGAHYDSKEIPGFVGANDGAGGTAALIELARDIKPRTIGPTIVWIAFDGEEAPGPKDPANFEKVALRGAKVAAKKYSKGTEAMILLDFIADKDLRTPREGNSNLRLWNKLRAAAKRVGTQSHYPDDNFGPVEDDHLPFLQRGVASIDLIDFDFPCWHMKCDDLTAVSKDSLDVSGETVRELLASL